jgi:ssDNA-specific exonuclease RecJ
LQTKNEVTDPDYNGFVDLGKELSAMQNVLNEQIDKLDKVFFPLFFPSTN